MLRVLVFKSIVWAVLPRVDNKLFSLNTLASKANRPDIRNSLSKDRGISVVSFGDPVLAVSVANPRPFPPIFQRLPSWRQNRHRDALNAGVVDVGGGESPEGGASASSGGGMEGLRSLGRRFNRCRRPLVGARRPGPCSRSVILLRCRSFSCQFQRSGSEGFFF